MSLLINKIPIFAEIFLCVMIDGFSLDAYRHSVDIQVRFSDFDLQGHVSNTVYQTYYDHGKQDYFDLVLGDIDWDTQTIVGASIKIDYLKPIWIKTRITVKTRVTHIGHKSMNFGHCIVNRVTGELISTCKAVLVCYDPRKRRSIPVPEQWQKDIMAYEGELLFS